MGYSQLFMMLEITMQGVFYGIGKTIPPAIISIALNYLRIPIAIFLVKQGMELMEYGGPSALQVS